MTLRNVDGVAQDQWDGTMFLVTSRCNLCGEMNRIGHVDKQAWHAVSQGKARAVDVFPDRIPVPDRVQVDSGICKKCWDVILGPETKEERTA